MRVLVTGGAGFIGSHIADAFLARGDQVAVADNLSTGDPSRLDSQVTFIKLDVTDATALSLFVLDWHPDVICHLASRTDAAGIRTQPSLSDISGAVSVLESALHAGSRVIFASSAAVYSRDAERPYCEDSVTGPESPYGTAKLCAEYYAGLYNRMHGTRHCVLRLANVYGPRQYLGAVRVFCARILTGEQLVVHGDGSQTRDFIHVSDVARAFTAAAGQPEPGTWNVGTGTETSLADLIRLITDVTGRAVVPDFRAWRPGELPHSCLAPGLAASGLGWYALVKLPAGVRDVCRWIQAGEE